MLTDLDVLKNECNEYGYAPHCFVPFGVWNESTWDILPKASWGQRNTFSGRGGGGVHDAVSLVGFERPEVFINNVTGK